MRHRLLIISLLALCAYSPGTATPASAPDQWLDRVILMEVDKIRWDAMCGVGKPADKWTTAGAENLAGAANQLAGELSASRRRPNYTTLRISALLAASSELARQGYMGLLGPSMEPEASRRITGRALELYNLAADLAGKPKRKLNQ